MKSFKKLVVAPVVVSAFVMTGSAFADHNSIWGEGWANMPNDVHDTRIDTLDDQEAFLDFIGGGGMQGGSSTDVAVLETGSGMGGGQGMGGAMAGGQR